jgi:DNA-binding MarR family transcriptional regulator
MRSGSGASTGRKVCQSGRAYCGADAYRVRIGRPAAGAPNEVWAMDFMSDTLFDGRSFPDLTVVDCHTREAGSHAVRKFRMALSKTSKETRKSNRLLSQIKQLNLNLRLAEQDDPILGTTDVMAKQWRHEQPGLELGAFELAMRVRRLAMLLDERLSIVCRSLGISLSDFLLLMALRRQGPSGSLRPTEIMKMHSVTSGTVTYRIDRLLAQDFVARVQDPVDLRSYLVCLTAHGRKVVDQGVARFAEINDVALRAMTTIRGTTELFTEMLRHYELRMEDELRMEASAVPSAPAFASARLCAGKEGIAKKRGKSRKTQRSA